MVKLTIYFAALIAAIVSTMLYDPELAHRLPIGGTDAIEIAQIEIDRDSLTVDTSKKDSMQESTVTPTLGAGQIARVAIYLAFSLAGTIVVMIPITWTYVATKREIGYRKNFVRALVVLPICATTIVLLIQDSLALAFGLAAMVAAVRFRVALREAIDGIYIFAAICVGLAAGIGYLGIAAIMGLFFCLTNAWLWHIDYGQNPLDDAQRQRKREKLQRDSV